jgi:pyruvate kinase
MAANFGIIPYYHTGKEDRVVLDSLKWACEMGLCRSGHVAVCFISFKVVTSGQVIGFTEGTTTKMQVMIIP